MSRREYARYKLEARKRGEQIYDRDDSTSLIRAAFYEADKAEAASRRNRVIAICSGVAAIAGVAYGFVSVL